MTWHLDLVWNANSSAIIEYQISKHLGNLFIQFNNIKTKIMKALLLSIVSILFLTATTYAHDPLPTVYEQLVGEPQ